MFKTLSKIGVLALSGLLASQEASATAIASDFYNGFTLRPAYGQGDDGTIYGSPFGTLNGIVMTVQSHTATITKTESGNASVTFIEPSISASFARIGGQAVAEPGGYAFGSYTLTLTLAFTNQTGHDLAFLQMFGELSAFWPGAGSVGAKVDDSEFEFARYRASQDGLRLHDTHFCDTRGGSTGFFNVVGSSVHCAVSSPDTSLFDPSISDLDNGATKTLTFTLNLTFEASSIPEPATLALFGTGLLGLVALRRKQMAAH